MNKTEIADVVVVGAGVFGTWTAACLHRAGLRVQVVEAFGPAWTGATSGGESRVTRAGYGDAALYSEWAHRSLAEWRALSTRAGVPLFHETGVLWIHTEDDPLAGASVRVLAQLGIPFERLSTSALRSRYPVLRVDTGEAGILEPEAGALMARRAVQQLALELQAEGVRFIPGTVLPVDSGEARAGALPALRLADGRTLEAGQFVMACGSWLDRVCPQALAGRLFVSRQEVVFFGADRARTGGLPVWANFPFYGMPDFEGRGFKVANHDHGPVEDVDRVDRRVTAAAETSAREFLARRFPALADCPVTEGRVCLYESSHNGDFVIDRHPGLDNVWLVGCGSGHGFKHGPALGAHVAGLLQDREPPIERFALAGKGTEPDRAVH